MPRKLCLRTYKGQLHKVKEVITNYQENPKLLEEKDAQVELMANKMLAGSIERKFRRIQTEIIHEAPQDHLESEKRELLNFSQDCRCAEMECSILLETIAAKSSHHPTSSPVSAADSQNHNVLQLICTLSQEIQLNRQKRRGECENLEDVISAHTKDMRSLVENSKKDVPSESPCSIIAQISSEQMPNLESAKLPTANGINVQLRAHRASTTLCDEISSNGSVAIPTVHSDEHLWASPSDLAFNSRPFIDTSDKVTWNVPEIHNDGTMNIHMSPMEILQHQEIASQPVTTAHDFLQLPERVPRCSQLTVELLDHQSANLCRELDPVDAQITQDVTDLLHKERSDLPCHPAAVEQHQCKLSLTVYTCAVSKENQLRNLDCRQFLSIQIKQRVNSMRSLQLSQNCRTKFNSIYSDIQNICHEFYENQFSVLPNEFSSSRTQVVDILKAQESTTKALPLASSDCPPTICATPRFFGATGGAKSTAELATTMEKNLGLDFSVPWGLILTVASYGEYLATPTRQCQSLDPEHKFCVIEGLGLTQAIDEETAMCALHQHNQNTFMDFSSCISMHKIIGEHVFWDDDVTSTRLLHTFNSHNFLLPVLAFIHNNNPRNGGAFFWNWMEHKWERKKWLNDKNLALLQQFILRGPMENLYFPSKKFFAPEKVPLMPMLMSMDNSHWKFGRISATPERPPLHLAHQRAKDDYRSTVPPQIEDFCAKAFFGTSTLMSLNNDGLKASVHSNGKL